MSDTGFAVATGIPKRLEIAQSFTIEGSDIQGK